LILFRHCDRRFPFLWEATNQPAARWHAEGEGPVQYFADTPTGAWAEFLRHEGITDEADLEGVERALWAIEVPTHVFVTREPSLEPSVLRGGLDSYQACQKEARRLRAAGAEAIRAPSAALETGGAGGFFVDGGEREARPMDGAVYVVFGRQSACIGWPVVEAGAAPSRSLSRVLHL
jgi:hypothetical protein